MRSLGNITGGGNTAIGPAALQNNTTGNNNIALGNSAGLSLIGDDNIDIGNNGDAGDSGTTRIGGSFRVQSILAGIAGPGSVGAGGNYLLRR